jgi:hypothetical protein
MRNLVGLGEAIMSRPTVISLLIQERTYSEVVKGFVDSS